MEQKYTVSDIATTFGVSERTVQRWIETLVFKEKNKIIIPKDVFKLLKTRHRNDIIATELDTDVQEFERIEHFTNEEYEEFYKRLIEYPILKDQLEYHRKSAESHNTQMEMILNMMQQRNYIEAKEKKID